MDKKLITTLQNDFNSISNVLEGTEIEFWYARELQNMLGYQSWNKFLNVIEKAKVACVNSGVEVLDHFRHMGKMVIIGSVASKYK